MSSNLVAIYMQVIPRTFNLRLGTLCLVRIRSNKVTVMCKVSCLSLYWFIIFEWTFMIQLITWARLLSEMSEPILSLHPYPIYFEGAFSSSKNFWIIFISYSWAWKQGEAFIRVWIQVMYFECQFSIRILWFGRSCGYSYYEWWDDIMVSSWS
jgi:hypothetical protein